MVIIGHRSSNKRKIFGQNTFTWNIQSHFLNFMVYLSQMMILKMPKNWHEVYCIASWGWIAWILLCNFYAIRQYYHVLLYCKWIININVSKCICTVSCEGFQCGWTRKLNHFIKAPLRCRPRPETITFETQFFPALKFEFRCWEEYILKYFLR